MKTADVEISGARRAPWHELVSLLNFRLPWRRTARKRYKGGTPATAGAGGESKTRTSRSLAQAIAEISRDGGQHIGIYGDAAFFQSARAAAGNLDCRWFSNDFLTDQPQGAARLTADALTELDAILVGGRDVATNYRLVLRQMLVAAPEIPVHWVAENWEFCGGTLAVPQEIDDVDALIFNHFEEFFGVKDPLQFRFELVSEAGTQRAYRILGPNQAVNLNLRELMPGRSDAVCLRIWITHPQLTRGRHYRFRPCADVFWKDSFTIVHGSHQFFKSPNRRQEFRLIDGVVRRGHAIMTVPNYDLDMGSNDEITIGTGADKVLKKRSRRRPLEEVHFPRQEKASDQRHYYAFGYHGYGTSFWYALEEGISSQPGKQASLSGNHLCRVGVDNRSNVMFRPEERALIEQATAAGFMIHPCCLPILPDGGPLGFGFNFDASNPPFEDYYLRFYDRAGRFVGDYRYHKDAIGPALIDEVLKLAPEAARNSATMALVAPDYLSIDLAPQRLITTADLIIRHRITGDQDATEFQSSWRNLGTQIPTLPHWLHPSIAVMGRTNVIGRARLKNGHRTAVFVANASGNLNYAMTAQCEINVINLAGLRRSHIVALPAFGAEVVWLDQVIPDLATHLGDAGIGTLQVKSSDADLTAHVVGLSPDGAVGLQHLWGY
ncbi:MAG TPA: hypothetical protein VM639_19940 [Dongiaceae bacterium]|nr:hypothetical protein [Dongiaceae bacterium]